MSKLKIWLNKLRDIIFPDNYACIICQEELKANDRYCMCYDCLHKVEFIGSKACMICGAKVVADSVICTDCKKQKRVVEKNDSAIVFDGDVRQRIHDFKYSGKRYLARPLGRLLYDKYLDIKKEFVPDIIVAVPLHEKRIKERGYNQTELLLNNFEKDREIIDYSVLKRVINTPHQARLPREKRKENVKDAFIVVDIEKVKGKNVLIVDDIYTTGATIDECCKVLLDSGAKSVRSLTLAHSHIDSAVLKEDK